MPAKKATTRKNSAPLRFTHIVTVRLNDEQIAALRLDAAEEGTSMSTVAREAIVAHLERLYPEMFTTSPEVAS